MVKVVCESCRKRFEAKRATAKYCSTSCRQKASRSRSRRAEAADAPPARKRNRDGNRPPELVKAVRSELTRAGALDSFHGRLALQLAERLSSPGESGISALSKELRTVMDAALDRDQKPAPSPEQPDPSRDDDQGPAGEVEDEVARARKERDAKLSQAAGRA